MIPKRIRALVACTVIAFCTATGVQGVGAQSRGAASAKPLFCSYGGVGMAQPGAETQFAVAVIEIDSVRESSGMKVSNFELFDTKGKSTKFRRVVEIEVFERIRVSTEGEHAYYLNPGDTRPWNGTLPPGKIRLRVRVSLRERPIDPVRFRLQFGTYVIEGRVDGSWPT